MPYRGRISHGSFSRTGASATSLDRIGRKYDTEEQAKLVALEKQRRQESERVEAERLAAEPPSLPVGTVIRYRMYQYWTMPLDKVVNQDGKVRYRNMPGEKVRVLEPGEGRVVARRGYGYLVHDGEQEVWVADLWIKGGEA